MKTYVMLDELIKEERERQARLLIESGGPTPKARKTKSSRINGGEYAQLVDLVFADPHPTPEWAPLPSLPDGIHPDAVFRQRSGAAWKAQITGVDVSLNGNGSHRHLSVKEVSRLYSAVAYANRKGMVFNAHIIISWRLLGIGKADDGEVARIKGVLQRVSYLGALLWIEPRQAEHCIPLCA